MQVQSLALIDLGGPTVYSLKLQGATVVITPSSRQHHKGLMNYESGKSSCGLRHYDEHKHCGCAQKHMADFS